MNKTTLILVVAFLLSASIFQEEGPFSLCQNSDLSKASIDDKWHLGIWQSTGLVLVNINVHAKYYQNIPHGSRVKGNFHKVVCRGHETSQTDRGWTHNVPIEIITQDGSISQNTDEVLKKWKLNFSHLLNCNSNTEVEMCSDERPVPHRNRSLFEESFSIIEVKKAVRSAKRGKLCCFDEIPSTE